MILREFLDGIRSIFRKKSLPPIEHASQCLVRRHVALINKTHISLNVGKTECVLVCLPICIVF